eukprot:NODE_1257_length_937_cov_973.322072_g1042_i0.p1 GENE.NODE_1257_length_937_cov_973.322072_g1042_i0~~NODE_1257_length_937_cov_973.322072_g1042_i0.p1  ORF type:complete len:188 (+),score=51.32 NODE_1257_length_937_cov_973.322072_g1042_i0:57-620(+)
MRVLNTTDSVAIPEGVTVTVAKRYVTVKGPRGTLERDFHHAHFDMKVVGDRFVVELWFGKKNQIALVKTILSHVRNMITGVTKGIRVRMRFAYAHFPINVTVENSVVEIRNFLGEKVVRRVPVSEGVTCTRTDPAKQKDELVLEGNDLEQVTGCAASIHQSCLVKKKDIRKFLDGIYVSEKGHVVED